MSDQALALAPTNSLVLEPIDRRPRPSWSGAAGMLLSLLVLATALYQIRTLSVSEIVAAVPASPLFWLLFVVAYLVGPASEWIIFRRLWGVGANAFGALIRKLIYNELLLGYLGEAYFYGWARKRLRFVTAPFGAVKDLALLSAVAGNIMTLAFLLVAYPYFDLLPVHEHATAITWSFVFVIGTSFVILFFRRSIFSLDRGELAFIFTMQLARILASVILSAALWHLAMPSAPIALWFVLATIRLLISRLPFVPNKDVVFAGVAILVLGKDVEVAALMTAMAALILAAHVLVGAVCAIADLIKRETNEPAVA